MLTEIYTLFIIDFIKVYIHIISKVYNLNSCFVFSNVYLSYIYICTHTRGGRNSSVGIEVSPRAGRSGVQTPIDRICSPLNIGCTEYQDYLGGKAVGA